MSSDDATAVERVRAMRPRRRVIRPLRRLALAAAISIVVYVTLAPWMLRDLSQWSYTLSWLVRPETGFLALTAALWMLFTVPEALRRQAALRRDAEVRRARARRTAGRKGPRGRTVDPEGNERLRIPAQGLAEIDAEHRREVASALGIAWRDALLRDDERWARACRAAAEVRAASARR